MSITLYQIANSLQSMGVCIKSVRDLTMLACANITLPQDENGKVILSKKEADMLRVGGAVLTKSCKKERWVNTLYNPFCIPKSNGKRRWVVELQPHLRSIHDGLLKIMSPVIEKRLPPQLCGCRPGHSVVDVATDISSAMSKGTIIGHLDVVNWYPSIKREDVELVLKEYVDLSGAEIMSIILTYKGRLPQGSPCSPLMANAVAHRTWGGAITKYCDENKLFLRIYVDNVVVAGDMIISDLYDHLRTMGSIIRKYGYQTHKINVMAPYRRQKVLGAILNNPHAPRVPKRTKKQIKTILHKAKKKVDAGESCLFLVEQWLSKYGGNKRVGKGDLREMKYRVEAKVAFYQWIIGMLSWVGQFPRECDKKFSEKYKAMASKYLEPTVLS